MSQPATNSRVLRFGLFELDLDVRELRKSGIRIKLQEQPFLILAMLLQRPGTIVTREELKKKLWSDDTFVDFRLEPTSDPYPPKHPRVVEAGNGWGVGVPTSICQLTRQFWFVNRGVWRTIQD